MLYCRNCKKWANKKSHKCNINSLISLTKNMLPIATILDSNLGLPVASAFCLTDKHNLVEAGVYFKYLYPEVILQDLPTGWAWTDYITIEHNALCSCLVYEYVYTGTMSLKEYTTSVINDLIIYLASKDKDGLRAIMLLSDS